METILGNALQFLMDINLFGLISHIYVISLFLKRMASHAQLIFYPSKSFLFDNGTTNTDSVLKRGEVY